jgi:hypothetical protein
MIAGRVPVWCRFQAVIALKYRKPVRPRHEATVYGVWITAHHFIQEIHHGRCHWHHEQ